MATTTTPDDASGPHYRETQRGLLLFRLETTVDDEGLSVRLAPFQLSPRRVPFADVAAVETATYDAGEHGGWHWGVRVGPGGNTAYRLSGSRGVRIRLADGGTLFVGSGRPRELRDAVAAGLDGA